MDIDKKIEPEDFNALHAVLAAPEGVRFWRGHARAEWQLDSTIVRRLRAEGRPPEESKVRWAETRLISRARHRGFDIADGVRLTDFELLGLLRHYGAATRLLDFSRSAYVGLWFASAAEPEVPGELIGIHSHFVGGHEAAPLPDDDYEKAVERLDRHHHPQSWEPRRTTPRVAAQHAHFLYGPVRDVPYGTLEVVLAPSSYTDVDPLVVYVISPRVKREALEFLRSVMDVGWETMYPDLPGFGVAHDARALEPPDRW